MRNLARGRCGCICGCGEVGWCVGAALRMRSIWRAFISAIMRQQRMTGQASGKSSDDSSLFCLPNEGQELGNEGRRIGWRWG